jgi:hypothetical protein
MYFAAQPNNLTKKEEKNEKKMHNYRNGFTIGNWAGDGGKSQSGRGCRQAPVVHSDRQYRGKLVSGGGRNFKYHQ